MATVDVKSEDEVVESNTTEPMTEVTTAPKPKKAVSKHVLIEALLFVTLVLVAFYAWNITGDKKDLEKQLASARANPQAIVQAQTDELIGQVGKLIDLPKNETPTIAAVTDLAAAKKQSSFFNNAQNGDKVLLYVKAGKAILYRPSTNKIIESQPLTINNSTTGSSTTTKQ